VEKYRRVRQATDDNTARMCNACWIPKATNIHTEYILLIAVALQQWLHERDQKLRYMYIVLLLLLAWM
jgi:hypothetical protein